MKEAEDEDVRDAGMLGCAQSVEHYEIARYGTLKAWAQRLGMDKAVQLLDETLQEEKETDAKLTMLAEQAINAEEVRGSRGKTRTRRRSRARAARAGQSGPRAGTSSRPARGCRRAGGRCVSAHCGFASVLPVRPWELLPGCCNSGHATPLRLPGSAMEPARCPLSADDFAVRRRPRSSPGSRRGVGRGVMLRPALWHSRLLRSLMVRRRLRPTCGRLPIAPSRRRRRPSPPRTRAP